MVRNRPVSSSYYPRVRFYFVDPIAVPSRMRACRSIDLEWSSCDISTAADLLLSVVCAHRRLRTESSPRSSSRLRPSAFRDLGTPTTHRIVSQRKPHRGSSFTCPRRLPVLRRHSSAWNSFAWSGRCGSSEGTRGCASEERAFADVRGGSSAARRKSRGMAG